MEEGNDECCACLGADFFDEPAIARALRVTLLAILASAFAISALTLFLRWRLTPQLTLMAGTSSMVALVLSRYGRTKPAMMRPLLGIIYVVPHLAARSDGIQNIGLAMVPVLIMVLERRMLLLFPGGMILSMAGMLAIRYFVLRAEAFSNNDMGSVPLLPRSSGRPARRWLAVDWRGSRPTDPRLTRCSTPHADGEYRWVLDNGIPAIVQVNSQDFLAVGLTLPNRS